MRLVSLMFAMFAVVVGCSARTGRTSEAKDITVEKDTVMRKALGDSIYNILVEAKNVNASLKLKTADNKNDSTVNVKIGKNDKYVLRFILSDPSNYKSNDTVYGQYVPNFSLQFTASKGKTCKANFDFGLKKWNICNAKEEEIAKFDLPTDEVLRMANLIFPDCELFKVLINSTENK